MTNPQNENSALPTFLVIGAMKAGTSSLHSYLSAHPEIYMSQEKELNFFNTSLNWNKGIDWYKSQFDANYEVRGESSPNYAKWEGTAERIHSVLPEAKLIYVLRDPVDRFTSHCNHKQLNPNEVVDNLKKGIDSEIFSNGLYFKWYKAYNTYYKKDDILILKSEELRNSKKEVLFKVFHFLNLESENYNFDSELVNTEKHITKDKLLASEQIHSLNGNKFYKVLKQVLKPMKPMLKPIQSKLFYKKRIIKNLTLENKNYLREKYTEDLEKLQSETGISINYGY
jgi:hypothetical protein